MPVVNVRAALSGLLVTTTFAGQALASSRANDVVSTKQFVAAAHRFLVVAVQRHAGEEASADALIKHISNTCPRSLPGSTRTGSAAQQATWTALTGTAWFELALAEFDPVRRAIQRELGALQSLRWTIPALNRATRRYVHAGRALLALPRPDLCAETKAASASQFTVVPPKIARFVQAANASGASSQPSLSDLAASMKQFVTRQDAAKVADLHRLDNRLDQLSSAFGLDAFVGIVKALSGV